MNNTLSLLKQLISIPSFVDENNNESELVKFVVTTLSQNKRLKISEQEVENGRKNIIALDGDNPQIILFGHMDTVLPKEQQRNPFEAYEDSGKLYGLGSVDMKSGLAIMLDIATNSNLSGIGYIFTVGEETDFCGAKKLILNLNIAPKLIINIEPTDLKILNGCRGVAAFDLEIEGRAAHSGRKYLGINAIEKSVELINRLEKACQAFDLDGVQTSINLCYLNGGFLSESGEIKSVDNIVPNYAKLSFSIRIGNSRVTEEFVKNNIKETCQNLSIRLKSINTSIFEDSFFTQKNELKTFEKAVEKSGLPIEYADINEQGFYEVAIVQSVLGCDCVVFGSGPNKMSHCKDEYVDISSVTKTQEILLSFLRKKILFICQANVGRSQMAEGLYNHLSKSTGAISAAVEDFREKYDFRPTAEIVESMSERGIDISKQRMKLVTPEMCDLVDKIVVLCNKKFCPEFLLDNPKAVFREIVDPFGKEKETIGRIRDQIELVVRDYIE